MMSENITEKNLTAWRSYGRSIKVAEGKHWKKTGKLTEYEILPADGEPKTNLNPSLKQRPTMVNSFDAAFMERWQQEIDQIPKRVELLDDELL